MSNKKPLELDAKDLINYIGEQKVLYASCGYTGKKMYLTFAGGIEVWKDDKFIRGFIQPFPAVEFFNELK